MLLAVFAVNATITTSGALKICCAPIHNFRNLVPMDHQHSPSASTFLASVLSTHFLSDPPSPPCALPQLISLISEKQPFARIEANSPALHKWNTRVSSLLQSKNAESRYWGVCLVKVTVSCGGEGLGHTIVWSKLLLTLLNVRSLREWN